jgi:hypothetical protein
MSCFGRCVVGNQKECYDGIVVEARRDGASPETARVTHGFYSLALPPGSYRVCPQARGPGAAIRCADVTVEAQGVRRVDISFSYGISGQVYSAIAE